MPSKLLEQARFPRRDAQMMQLNLPLRPSESGRASEGGRVSMFIDAVEQRLTGGGDDCPKSYSSHPARRNAQASAQGEDRVQDGARAIRERPSINHRDWRSNALATTKKARPVGFNLQFSHHLAVDDGEMRRP